MLNSLRHFYIRTFPRGTHVTAWLIVFGWCATAFGELQPTIPAFLARVPVMERQIPAIAISATAAAENALQHPTARLNTPYQGEPSFAEELIFRAGSLAIAFPTDQKTATPHDFVLFSVRSWQKHKDTAPKLIREYRAKGWKVVLFASAAGKPTDVEVDYFFDNGAPSGDSEHGRINILVNVTLGWMWCCEYAGGMSRKGKFPAVLYSISMPGAIEFCKPLQTESGRLTVHPCDKPIAVENMATIYLDRVKKLAADLSSDRTRKEIEAAAKIIADRMRAGRTVGLTGVGHMILYEFDKDTRVPWKPFDAAGRSNTAFKEKLKPGDLVVWIGDAGVSSPIEDFSRRIKEARLDLIASTIRDPERSRGDPPMLAHIEQHWQRPDAEVPIPIFPFKMAPVSAQAAGLTMRMLDDAVAEQLKKK